MQANYNKRKNKFAPLSFLVNLFKPVNRPSLILVTNHWNECKNESQRLLCRTLRENGLYASPDFFVGNILIHVALVPYRIAFLKKQDTIQRKKIIRSLQRKGWTVYFISDEKLKEDVNTFLYTFTKETQSLKNASPQ
ncbi:hypothetical protein [Shouchella lehensis]|uniref:DUF559 domain-containing protein n=1 Tax=Shouchella lehensis TaxID=300825 RepID=A0A4Y7WQZ8_9BACI|nr:hypothetical protein [Shouchella lehensis]RQW21021.1 hypothetical protein EH196_13220 [Bacillus sp. C1-1]TES51045.1 hypothetical protein E2L03_03735 [Shouchella lehensis]